MCLALLKQFLNLGCIRIKQSLLGLMFVFGASPSNDIMAVKEITHTYPVDY